MMSFSCIAKYLSGLLLAALPSLQADPEIIPGATELSPSRSQYFSWINNTNEGATEAQTLTNIRPIHSLSDSIDIP
jgi:hypothetical protein